LLAVAGCATPPGPAPGPRVVSTTLVVDREAVLARWTVPEGPAAALVTLQHGFARRCRHLDGTARRIAARGLLTLCVEAPMARGNPVLAESLAALLAQGLRSPDGNALPQTIIVGGHSAGAVFAVRLGARLDALSPQRLAGALLFDPVAAGSFSADLQAVSRDGQRPVLAITATRGPCNAQHSAYPALRAVRQQAQAAGREAFVGVELTQASTHADAEGEDTDWLAELACGPPVPANTERLRSLAAQWAADLAAGAAPLPESTSGSMPIE
jgi:acetyl esterase/lipase